MEITVIKEFTFDAAHKLPSHPGKCKNLHGHTYRLQVGAKGPIDPETGMVVDFATVKEIVESTIVNALDHGYLNEMDRDEDYFNDFPKWNPTAELMVAWMVLALTNFFNEQWEGIVKLALVRLYETPTSYAEWRAC